MELETEISERYRVLRSQVRRREGVPVVLRERFCPGCATVLAVDLTQQDDDPAPAPRLRVVDPYQEV